MNCHLRCRSEDSFGTDLTTKGLASCHSSFVTPIIGPSMTDHSTKQINIHCITHCRLAVEIHAGPRFKRDSTMTIINDTYQGGLTV